MLTVRCRTVEGQERSVKVDPAEPLAALLDSVREWLGGADPASPRATLRLLLLAPPAADLASPAAAAAAAPRLPVPLDLASTAAASGLQDGAEVLVLGAHRRPAEQPDVAKLPAVTMAQIEAATAGLTPKNEEQGGITRRPPQPEVQMQLVSVMSALLSVAKTIQEGLGVGAAATSPTGADMPGSLDGPDLLNESDTMDVDPAALQALMEMGFPEARATKALVLTGMQVEAAMEWLFVHADDPNADVPLTPPPKATASKTGRSFKPDRVAFQRLKELGFPNVDVVAALQLSRNNFEAACDWLIGGEDVHSALREQEDLADTNNPMVQELLKDARVQNSLVEPRVRRAFEAMIRDTSTAAMYLHDPVIAPVLQHMSQILSGAS